MLCPICNNGFLCKSLPRPHVLSYRGFTKQIGTEILLECSSCLYEDLDSVESIVDVDAEMIIFKREINKKLAIGEEL